MRKSRRIVRYTQTEIEEKIGARRGFAPIGRGSTRCRRPSSRPRSPPIPTRTLAPSSVLRGYAEIPSPKEALDLQLDAGVLDWFKSQGRDYRARINAVLRAYVEHQRERSRST